MQRVDIERLHELSDRVNDLKHISQEQIKTAKDRYNDREVKIMREGKEIEVKESALWTEVYHLGLGCDAGKKLKELHPELFEALKEQDKAADELKVFCIEMLGVDYTQMTLSDYVHVSEKLFNVLFDERMAELKKA